MFFSSVRKIKYLGWVLFLLLNSLSILSADALQRSYPFVVNDFLILLQKEQASTSQIPLAFGYHYVNSSTWGFNTLAKKSNQDHLKTGMDLGHVLNFSIKIRE